MALVGILIYLVAACLVLPMAYVVIRLAVRHGMDDHYRVVRWYEKTGEWTGGGKPPRAFGSGPVSQDSKRQSTGFRWWAIPDSNR